MAADTTALPETVTVKTEPLVRLLAEMLEQDGPARFTELVSSLSADDELTSVLAEVDARVDHLRAARDADDAETAERETLEARLLELLRHARGDELARVAPIVRWNHDRLAGGAPSGAVGELREKVEWLEENLRPPTYRRAGDPLRAGGSTDG